MVAGAQSNTVALDGLYHLVDGLILGYHLTLETFSHTLQTYALAGGNPAHGHSRHYRYYLGHIVGGNHMAHAVRVLEP